MILPEDYINRPVRSLQTMLRVLSTIFPALLNVNPDGIYGESTKNAVSAFQRFAHLPATALPKPKPGTRLPAATCATRRVSCRRSRCASSCSRGRQLRRANGTCMSILCRQCCRRSGSATQTQALPPSQVFWTLPRSAPCGACRRCSVTSRPASLTTASGRISRGFTPSRQATARKVLPPAQRPQQNIFSERAKAGMDANPCRFLYPVFLTRQ